MIRLLGFVLLAVAGGAQAGTWSVGADLGRAQLDSRHHDDAEVDTGTVLGLHAGWWFNRYVALEVGWRHADTGYRTGTLRVERDFDALLAGARLALPFGTRGFAFAKGGYAHQFIDTEEPRVGSGGVAQVRDDSDAGHYLGIGVGWRWNARWQSTLEFTRVYGDVAYGCEFGDCATTHSSYLDGVTVGIVYRFD